MSRGGRGGRGGARGGLPQGVGRDWEVEDVALDSKPSELFPSYRVPTTAPSTEQEKREVAAFLELRSQIHQGPLYTRTKARDLQHAGKIFGEEQDNAQYTSKSKADVDPFVGVPTYTMKYDQKQRAIPQLSGRPFNKELFPQELWSTLEGESGEAVRDDINKAMKKKALMLSTPDFMGNLTAEEKKKKLDEKLKDLGEEDEAEVDGERDEEEGGDEQDYDYEQDEDDMGGDYDAEQYFDGGENDEDDGDGGGGDDY